MPRNPVTVSVELQNDTVMFFLLCWSATLYTEVMKASEGPRLLRAPCQTQKKKKKTASSLVLMS